MFEVVRLSVWLLGPWSLLTFECDLYVDPYKDLHVVGHLRQLGREDIYVSRDIAQLERISGAPLLFWKPG